MTPFGISDWSKNYTPRSPWGHLAFTVWVKKDVHTATSLVDMYDVFLFMSRLVLSVHLRVYQGYVLVCALLPDY